MFLPRFDVLCVLSEYTHARLNGIYLFYTLFGYGPVRNIGNVFENLHVDDLRGDRGAKIVFYYVIYDLYKESTPIG